MSTSLKILLILALFDYPTFGEVTVSKNEIQKLIQETESKITFVISNFETDSSKWVQYFQHSEVQIEALKMDKYFTLPNSQMGQKSLLFLDNLKEEGIYKVLEGASQENLRKHNWIILSQNMSNIPLRNYKKRFGLRIKVFTMNYDISQKFFVTQLLGNATSSLTPVVSKVSHFGRQGRMATISDSCATWWHKQTIVLFLQELGSFDSTNFSQIIQDTDHRRDFMGLEFLATVGDYSPFAINDTSGVRGMFPDAIKVACETANLTLKIVAAQPDNVNVWSVM